VEEEEEEEEEERGSRPDQKRRRTEREELETVQLNHHNQGFLVSSTHCVHVVWSQHPFGSVLGDDGQKYQIVCNSGTLRRGKYYKVLGNRYKHPMWSCPNCQGDRAQR
jgi:hypothetical protein